MVPMLAGLAAAIENVDIPGDHDSVIEALALRDRLDARIAAATGELEAAGIWAGDAALSFVHWLRGHAVMTPRSAQRLRTLAIRLRSLPRCWVSTLFLPAAARGRSRPSPPWY